MHCKACDKVLSSEEIYIDERTGEFEPLCSVCREIALASMGIHGYLSDDRAAALSRKAARNYAAGRAALEK